MKIRVTYGAPDNPSSYECDAPVEIITFESFLKEDQAASITMKFTNGDEVTYERIKS